MKRFDLKIGFECNNHCRHCVQGKKRILGRPKTVAALKMELRQARQDCQTLVFTGGEPTLHNRLIALIRFASEIGYTHIQIQTNGRRLAYGAFAKACVDAGADEFAIALHGHTASLHDYLTQAPGSFDQTILAIKNIRRLGLNVITNTVITKPNYRNLPDIARLLVNLDVKQFQFAFVHILGFAKKNWKNIVPRMSLVMPYVKAGLDIGVKAGKNVMTEAIPLCLLGDHKEFAAEKIIPQTKISDFRSVIENFTIVRQTEGKTKGPRCESCCLSSRCEGPWREYPEYFGWDEFVPPENSR